MRTLLLCLFAACAAAAAAGPTLDGVRLGTHISGPPVTAADLKGRVVLFEYWGVNCPPCLRSIPHLSAWQKQFDRETFVLVANHCQGGSADNIRQVWGRHGGTADVSVVDAGDLPGANVRGIPHCFLFDHEGRLIYQGSPFQVEEPLKKAVAASPGALVAGYEWRKLAKEAVAIGRRQNLASAVKAVRRHADGKDEAAQTEAAELLTRLTAWAGREEQAMQAARSDDPAESFRIANTMATALKGDALAAPFEAMAKELRADKAAQQAITATERLARVKALAQQHGLAADPAGWLARASNRGKAQEIAGGLRTIIKQHAGTKAAAEAAELAKAWKMDVP